MLSQRKARKKKSNITSHDDTELKNYIQKAIKALDVDNYEDAEHNFRRGLDYHYNNFKCLVGLGQALHLQKKCCQALVQFEKALAIRPLNAHVFHWIAGCYIQMGLFSRAIEFYNKKLLLAASHDAYFDKGFACLTLNNFNEMHKCFLQIAIEDSMDIPSRCYLGLSFIYLKQIVEGYTQLTYILNYQIAKQVPINKLTILTKNGIRAAKIPYVKKKEILQNNIKITPSILNIILDYEIQNIRVTQDDTHASLLKSDELYSDLNLVDQNDKIEILHALGIAFRSVGEFALAHEYFIEALSEARQNSSPFCEKILSIHLQIAFTFQKEHKNELAIKTLQEASQYGSIENEDVIKLLRELEGKRNLSIPMRSPISPLEKKPKQPIIELYIPPERKHEEPDSSNEFATEQNSPNHSSDLLNPVSPSSETIKAINTTSSLSLFESKNLASVSEKKSDSSNIQQESQSAHSAKQDLSAKSLVTANSSFFQPTPLSRIILNDERKVNPTATKSCCVIL